MTMKMKESAKRNLDRLIGECVHSQNIERFRRELDSILCDGFESPADNPAPSPEPTGNE